MIELNPTPRYIRARRPNGQTMYINVAMIQAFKVNPMNDSECIIYLNADDINMNAFGPQGETDDNSGFTANVFYVSKKVLVDLIKYYPVENRGGELSLTSSSYEEIGEPLDDNDKEYEDPEEDIGIDEEEIGEPLINSQGYESPNEDE